MELLALLALVALFGGKRSSSTPPVVVDPLPGNTPPGNTTPPVVRSTSRWSTQFSLPGDAFITGWISRSGDGWTATSGSTWRVVGETFESAMLQLAARAYEMGAQTGDVRIQTTDGAVVGVVQRNSMPDGRFSWNVQTTNDVMVDGVQVARNLAIGELAGALQLVVDEADDTANGSL